MKQTTDESLIWRNIYILAGVTAFILLVMVGVWSFHWYSPLLKTTVEAQQHYQTRKEVADKLPDALVAQVKAQEQKVYAQNQLEFFQQKYRHLDFDYGVPAAGATTAPATAVPPEVIEAKKIDTWQHFMNEYYSGFGLALKNDLKNAYFNSGLTDINADIKVSPPPQVPEDLPPTPAGFLKPLSDNGGAMNIDVTGTYPSIMNFFTLINKSSILMTIGPIKLAGASPSIKASFTLTPYLVETGPAVKVSPGAGGGATAAPSSSSSGSPSNYPGSTGSTPAVKPSKPVDEPEAPTSNRPGRHGAPSDAQ